MFVEITPTAQGTVTAGSPLTAMQRRARRRSNASIVADSAHARAVLCP